MKLSLFFAVLATLQVSASGFGQTLSLSLTDAPLEKAFKEIRRQSGYSFVYTRTQIKSSKPVSCQLTNVTLNQALSACFKNQSLTYLIEDRYIIVQNISEADRNGNDSSVINIHGKVMGEKGQTLAGASISVKATGMGVSTNERGEFELAGIASGSVLIISNIGYLSQEIIARPNLVVRMNIAVANLEETVIKGYYATSKRLNTGSVAKVSGAEIARQPVSNPLAALEGRVSGLFIVQGTGLPGSNFSVLLRGKNSIQNGNSPLYIIDGVPFLTDADRLTQFNGTNTGSPFNTISPDDIQSIEILKDADATAIYGSRGANGVILITTKSGKPGKTKVDLNLYAGWGRISRSYDLMKTPDYLMMRREAFANDNTIPDNSNAFDLLVWDTTRYTDWKKELIGNTAHSNNVQLRVSGGSASTNFTLGANYYRETTVYPTSNNADKRLAVSVGLNHVSPNEKFRISLNASVANDNSHLLQSDLVNYVLMPPNTPECFDNNGELVFNKDGYPFSNPYAGLLQTYKTETNRLTASSNLSYRVIRNLSLRVNLGYSDVSTDELGLFPIASQDPAYNPLGGSFFASRGFRSWIIEPQADYNFQMGTKGKWQVLLGGTLQASTGLSSSISAYGFSSDAQLKDVSALPPSNIYNARSNSEYKYEGVYARINYNWDDKYLVNLSGRRDGSSRFGPEKRFANFGAVGLGWIFSKENFMQSDWLSFGKLRASYGITGNDRIDDYQYLDSWTSVYAYQSMPASRPTRLYNPDYGWETIRKAEAAVELGFLKGRLYLSVDWFRSVSDNQLIRYNLPAQTGFNNVLRNFPGKVQNQGVEIELYAELIKATRFGWTSKINFTFARNKLLAFPGLENSSYASDYVVGKSLSLIQGYQFNGVNPQSGLYQFADLNKDGSFTPREGSNLNDYVVIGTTDPAYYGGLDNEFRYGNWQLSFLFQFVKQMGRDAIYGNSNVPGMLSNQPIALLNRWQKPGDEKPYQKYSQDYGDAYTAQFMVSQSTAAYTNASYVRLKTLSLSYSLSGKGLKKSGLEEARIFVQCQNLFLLTGYKELDPENQSFYSLPPLRMYTVGIHITL